jgi:nucleoside phosphorylase
MATANADVVILTALQVEHEAMVRALGECAIQAWRGRTLHVGKVGNLDVLVFPINSAGNISSAQAATVAMNIWNPVCIFMVGIAGGFHDVEHDFRLGDVVVPDRIVGYEQAKVRPEGVEQRYEVVPPDWELLQVARRLEPGEWALRVAATRPDGQGGRIIPRAFFGPVFSGEKVIADGTAVEALRNPHWHKALGVEMEGLGVAIAAYRGGPGFLMVRAVSDFANAAKNDDWHAYAAEAAARFAVAVLRAAELTTDPRRPQATPLAAPRHVAGTVKLQVCRRLGDSWEDLADVANIPIYDQRRFRPTHESRDLWNYLESRGKIPVLAELLDLIDRADLAELIRAEAP